MAIALRYIAAPVLAASVAVTIAAATASAMAESQPARTVDASTTSPDHGGAYCGQFCGTYDAYSNDPDEVAAPAFYGVNTSRSDPLAAVSLRLPIIDADGVPVLQH